MGVSPLPHSRRAKLTDHDPRATFEDDTKGMTAEWGCKGSHIIRSGWPHAHAEAGRKAGECCSRASHLSSPV